MENTTINELQDRKFGLLKRFTELSKLHKQLYSNMDIASPMSAEEKALNKELADLSSQMQIIVRQVRILINS